jgi:hypothetical protein
MAGAGKRAVAKGRRFQVGALLIVAGAVLIALSIWLLITFHWVLPGPPRGWGGLWRPLSNYDYSRDNGATAPISQPNSAPFGTGPV